jgi:hypothetical protein
MAIVAAVACEDVPPEDGLQAASAQLAGAVALGAIPAGLPSRLTVGLFEDSGGTWMKSSAVPWDLRYRYFTKGWVNNWGFGAYDGGWGRAYFDECNQQGFIPAVQYYQMNGEPGGGESAFLAKVQSPTTMKGYFGDFKILLQRIKDFGKPVVVLLEADGFGFLEQQAGGNAAAYAAVKDSGVAELAGLPNTVAGWGLAFLQLRKAVGASNAILGIHISGWASGKDLAYGSVTDPLGPEVDKVYAFLSGFGIASNVTGQRFDVLVGDPLDRDSDYYRLVRGQDRWWDASDSASISSKSFNRYAEWLRLWNQKAARRWVLWQTPLGNSNHKNVANNGGSAEGYKDNRPEYFFAGSTAHLSKFADAGVIALMFGAGAGGQSSYQNDTFSDGQLFMKSRAGAFLKAGGLPLASGGGGGTGGSGGGAGGAGGSGGCVAPQGNGTGLTGDYFKDMTLTTRQLTRVDASVSFSWGTGAPDAALPVDGFSVRWTGQVQARAGGVYTFTTVSDDGVRLWIDGQQLVNNWTDHAATENSGSITLGAGQKYAIKMEYYEHASGATARLLWSSACETKAAIPTSQLYPAASGGDAAVYGFEGTSQSWSTSGGMLTGVASSTDRAFAGTSSLKVSFNGAAGAQQARVSAPAAPAGAIVTFHVWLPAGSAVSGVQPYVLQGAGGGWTWTGNWQPTTSLATGQWNTIKVTVPSAAVMPLAELGVQFTTTATWTGTAYVDSVGW